MTSNSTNSSFPQPATDTATYLFDDWFDPIEAGLREKVRGFIQPQSWFADLKNVWVSK